MVKLAMAVGRDGKKNKEKNEERDFSLLVPPTRILYQRKWLITNQVSKSFSFSNRDTKREVEFSGGI